MRLLTGLHVHITPADGSGALLRVEPTSCTEDVGALPDCQLRHYLTPV